MSSLVSYDPALAKSASKDGSQGDTNANGSSSSPSNGGVPPRIVQFHEMIPHLEKLISPELLNNQLEAYKAWSSGNVSIMPIQTLGQAPAGPMTGGPLSQTCVKTGYVNNADVYVIKVAGGGAVDQQTKTQFGNTGFLMVFSQIDLKLRTILFDEGILTEMRTAAATCLASSVLMPRFVKKIGILGGGVQAIWQLRFLRLITDCRKAVVKTSSRESAEKFVAKMKASECELDREWELEVFDDSNGDSESTFRHCDLIHTLTPGRVANIKMSDLYSPAELATRSNRRPLHISAIGADSPGKQELDTDILLNADYLVCDSLDQTKTRGEFQSIWDAETGKFGGSKEVIEIGAILNSDEVWQKVERSEVEGEDHNLTVFDTSGVAVQDVQIAKRMCEVIGCM